MARDNPQRPAGAPDARRAATPDVRPEPATGSSRAAADGLRRSRGSVLALQRLAGNAAAASAVRHLQRDGGAPAGTTATATPAEPALLVDAGVAPGPGQLSTEAFLRELRPALESTVEAGLAGTPYSVAGCPWIDHWITYYQVRPAAQLERALRLWAPQAAAAATGGDYVPAVCARVHDGVASWRSTGAVPSAPQGGPDAGGPAGGAPGAAPPAPAAPVQRAPDGPGQPGATVTTDGTRRAGTAAGSTGSGDLLDAGTRARLGGPDVDVRLHTGGAGRAVAERAGAEAVTYGRSISLAPGAPAPGTPLGDALLAHELAHVAQQQDATTRSAGEPDATPSTDDALEHDAHLGVASTLLRLHDEHAMAAAVEDRPRLRSGLRIARCSDTPALRDPRPDYDDAVSRLRVLYARKQAVVDGTEPPEALPSIDAGIAVEVARLRELGITVDADRIHAAVTAAEPVDLLQVRGRVERLPDGPAFLGQRMQLHAALDYLPAGRTAQYEWRWRTGGSREFQFLAAPGRSRATDLELGEPFWNLIDDDIRRSHEIEVLARVYLGEEETAVATLSSGSVALSDEVPGTISLSADPPSLVQGGRTTVRPAEWVPPRSTYSIDWDVDGEAAARDVPVLDRTFDRAGERQVTARLYQVRRSFGIQDRRLVQEVRTTLRVEDPVAAGERVLDAATPDRLPALGTVATSIEESIADMERRAALGGEQAEYWRDRIEAQRNRLARLREQAPGSGAMRTLPGDPAALDPAGVYSAAVPAAIVLPSGGGAQPLAVHLTLRHADGVWHARLIDSTSADVVHFDGQAATAPAAQVAALRAWGADHPYPRGGTVTYRGVAFAPGGSFETTTAWNTAKAWVDGILTVGGVVVAGLLLLTPEPTTGTKWLGAIILAASVGRSAVAIYENVTMGIPPTDSRNVLEGLSIVTALVGAGGSALRQIGVSAVRPTVYRAGNYLVMTSLAGDVGTLAFATEAAYAQVRAAQNDPTLDEGQRAMAVLRVISSVMLNGAMFFVSNRDLMKQGLRRSDFFRTDPAAVVRGTPPGEVRLETGARLDVAAELKAAGEPLVGERLRSRSLTDRELVDRHGTLPWMRQELTPPHVAEMLLHMETDALVALQDVGAATARTALLGLGDYGAANVLAPVMRGSGVASVAASRVATGSTIVVCPTNRGLVRINGELDISPRRLVEIPAAGREDVMRAYKALQDAGGSRAALTPADRELLDRVTGTSNGFRLRSEYHRAQADALLVELGITTLPAEQRAIFDAMTDADRDRLFDLVNERPPSAARDLRRQAAAYALPRSDSVRAFVEQYQVYSTHFLGTARARIDVYAERVRTEVAAATAASGGTPPTPKQLQAIQNRVKTALGITGNAENFYYAQVLHEMSGRTSGGAVDTTRPGAAAVADVEAEYQRRVTDLRGRVGSVAVPPGLPDAELVARLQGLGDIPFGSEPAAAYHVAKHYSELPPGVRSAAEAAGASDVDTYLLSAHRTIVSGSATLSSSQDGTARSVRFVHDGMIAIVRVGNDGRALLATHMGGR